MATDDFALSNPVPVGGRADLDHFPTPRWVTAALWAHGLGAGWWSAPPPAVLDPACGEGAILDHVRELGGPTFGYELHKTRAEAARARGHQVEVVDALAHAWAPVPLVVMNPPYGALAARFVHKGIDWLLADRRCARRLCVLLYVSFVEPAGDRRGLFRQAPPDVLVLPRRPKFDGRGTNSTASAWYCWPGMGRLVWLP